jgi:glycosyltransferase involved in cell wall biosynthesis
MVHKNIGPVIGAMQRLAVQRPDLKLVLTGARTDGASGRATALGIERTADGANVVGLGYVSDAAMADLITEASVVVNPSLYEAGNGSGLDAWGFGTPVAMSDIPPFTEHLTALGVQAELFDPRDPDAIASSIARIIDNRRQAQQAATASEAAMQHHTWDDVADGYLAVLDGAVQGGASQ